MLLISSPWPCLCRDNGTLYRQNDVRMPEVVFAGESIAKTQCRTVLPAAEGIA